MDIYELRDALKKRDKKKLIEFLLVINTAIWIVTLFLFAIHALAKTL